MLDDEKINISVAITVMQELAYLYKTKLKYTYQYNMMFTIINTRC